MPWDASNRAGPWSPGARRRRGSLRCIRMKPQALHPCHCPGFLWVFCFCFFALGLLGFFVPAFAALCELAQQKRLLQGVFLTEGEVRGGRWSQESCSWLQMQSLLFPAVSMTRFLPLFRVRTASLLMAGGKKKTLRALGLRVASPPCPSVVGMRVTRLYTGAAQGPRVCQRPQLCCLLSFAS